MLIESYPKIISMAICQNTFYPLLIYLYCMNIIIHKQIFQSQMHDSSSKGWCELLAIPQGSEVLCTVEMCRHADLAFPKLRLSTEHGESK